MNDSEWAQVLAMLRGSYPQAKLADGWAKTYFQVLGPFPFDAVMTALALWEDDSFPPLPALRRMAREACGENDDFDAAWREVMAAVKRWGVYECGSVEWSDPALADLVQAVGGFRRICLAPDDQAETLRAQARGFWQSITKRRRVDVEMGRARPLQLDRGRDVPTLEAGELVRGLPAPAELDAEDAEVVGEEDGPGLGETNPEEYDRLLKGLVEKFTLPEPTPGDGEDLHISRARLRKLGLAE